MPKGPGKMLEWCVIVSILSKAKSRVYGIGGGGECLSSRQSHFFLLRGVINNETVNNSLYDGFAGAMTISPALPGFGPRPAPRMARASRVTRSCLNALRQIAERHNPGGASKTNTVKGLVKHARLRLCPLPLVLMVKRWMRFDFWRRRRARCTDMALERADIRVSFDPG